MVIGFLYSAAGVSGAGVSAVFSSVVPVEPVEVVVAAATGAWSWGRSMISMSAMGALSVLRCPSLTMRQYPPWRQGAAASDLLGTKY